jgi:hypothetical protein
MQMPLLAIRDERKHRFPVDKCDVRHSTRRASTLTGIGARGDFSRPLAETSKTRSDLTGPDYPPCPPAQRASRPHPTPRLRAGDVVRPISAPGSARTRVVDWRAERAMSGWHARIIRPIWHRAARHQRRMETWKRTQICLPRISGRRISVRGSSLRGRRWCDQKKVIIKHLFRCGPKPGRKLARGALLWRLPFLTTDGEILGLWDFCETRGLSSFHSRLRN